MKQSIDAHGEWHLPFRVSRVADAIFWGDPENKGFAQVWLVIDGALGVFLRLRAFDEVRNRNRMMGGESVCSPTSPDTSVQEVFDPSSLGRSTYPLSPVSVGVLLLEPLCESEP